ncbi:hypothetical protein [Micromonospora mirobrigensis]|uniref:Uncharacterized protein n=1 Tax=Micromonospora mirobrigensis TaxID=262898 RepID=A0A1C4VSL7_9ACTN|nr:hypothetical protein [Micromonospora mirobrigensis]SCE86801.1 hypothetical protein GA0070564_1011413 [Micromonospora mirobrigensis]
MTRPTLPPIVEQTRVFLLTQTWLLLVGLLGLLLLLRVLHARGALAGTTGDDFLVLLLAAMVAPAVLAMAAWAVRRGGPAGWVLALLGELAVAFLLYAAVNFGYFLGVPVLILAGFGAWVVINLLRADVRASLFRRRPDRRDVAGVREAR